MPIQLSRLCQLHRQLGRSVILFLFLFLVLYIRQYGLHRIHDRHRHTLRSDRRIISRRHNEDRGCTEDRYRCANRHCPRNGLHCRVRVPLM